MISGREHSKFNLLSANIATEFVIPKYVWDFSFPDQDISIGLEDIVQDHPIVNRLLVTDSRIEGTWAERTLQKPSLDTHKSVDISVRLSELVADAEDEDLLINEKSKSALSKFLQVAKARAIPKLTINEKGNFRAVWEGKGSDQVGIEFEGTSRVNYVILIGPKNDKCDQHYGTCSQKNLFSVLTSLGVDRLISK